MKLPFSSVRKRYVLFGAAGAVVVLAILILPLSRTASHRPSIPSRPSTTQTVQKGPPWIYGRADARFTIVEYADLQCPYCREYFPIMRRWIAEHPDVNWQWHHLPLAMHEPAATGSARVAECAGEVGGNTAFWNAIAWLYEHARGDAPGLPAAQLPGMSPAIQTCLQSSRPDVLIQSQADAAARDQVTVTPTLRLIDRQGGKILTLQGPIEGDALLSAIDLLVVSSNERTHLSDE